MGQKQNRLFGMIHGLGGEAWLVVQDQGDAVFPWDVFGRYDYKIVPGRRCIKGNFSNLATRDVAAHRRAVKHAGQNHIIDIASCSGDLVPAFLARHRCPDDMTILQTADLTLLAPNEMNAHAPPSSCSNGFCGRSILIADDYKCFCRRDSVGNSGSFKCLLEVAIRRLASQFAPAWLSRVFTIGEYAVSAQVSRLDHSPQTFA